MISAQGPPRSTAEAQPFGFEIHPQAWTVDALCAETDPEAFFPEKGGSTREARSMCARCPVAAECADYAISGDERFGIWGGLSERERRKLRKGLNPTDQETA